MILSPLSVQIEGEQDVVIARRRARVVAEHLGYSTQDQIRLATAVSELSRNVIQYAGGGQVEFQIQPDERRFLVIVSDQGPGIAALEDILTGRYVSSSGMGVGLLGTRRLVDTFDVDTRPGCTMIRLGRRLPATASVTPADLQSLIRAVVRTQPALPLQELQVQHRELLGTLATLEQREEQLAALNQELENTNRGVVALYGELEEQAAQLREANRVQAMFLSYMSHEFRTPLSSMLGLTRLLIERRDGELTSEQERQVQLVWRSAGELLTMVDDLLEQARLQAGRAELQLTTFEMRSLFDGLRALFQPLVPAPQVRLIFGDCAGLPSLTGDEGKTTRILRNFISNALKFTVAGEVRVWATLSDDRQWITLGVTDTGVGITPADQSRLFQDFSQVGSPRIHSGGSSGLGLSLARQLAEQLGGRVQVSSAPGEGSRFSVTLPVAVRRAHDVTSARQSVVPLTTDPRVLLIDDMADDRDRLRTVLAQWGLTPTEAASGPDGLAWVRAAPPQVILLDLGMPEMDGLTFLETLRAQPAGHAVLVVVVTAQRLTPELGARLTDLGALTLSKAQVFSGDHAALWQAIAGPLHLNPAGDL